MPLTPLVVPDKFFQERPDPSLVPPALIFFLDAFLVAAWEVLYSSLQPGYYSGIFPESPLALILFVLLVSLLGLVWWPIEAGLLALVSNVFGGRGSFKRLLAYVGWGHLPLLFGTVIVFLIDLLLLEPSVAPTGIVTKPPLVAVVIVVVTVVTLLWAAYIWVYAVKHARHLRLRSAVLTTVILLAIYGGLSTLGFLSGLL